MAQVYTPAIRALVVAALLVATAALLHVTVQTARAAGALAIGSCGAYGEAHDFRTLDEAQRNALAKCKGEACRVVATVRRGCAALAVDYANAWRRARLGQGGAARGRAKRGSALLLQGWRERVRNPDVLLRRQGLNSASLT
jgi:Domain of unknown function (DUF4189)